jgi:hypothetical protein
MAAAAPAPPIIVSEFLNVRGAGEHAASFRAQLTLRASPAPQLPAQGIDAACMTFRQVTMESERYICVRLADRVAVVDCATPGAPPLWRPVTADATLMNPTSNIIALKKVVPGTVTHALQVFDIAANVKVKAHRSAAPVHFWSWLGPALMGLVTDTEVFHWSMEVRKRGEAWPDDDAARCPNTSRRAAKSALLMPTHGPFTVRRTTPSL